MAKFKKNKKENPTEKSKFYLNSETRSTNEFSKQKITFNAPSSLDSSPMLKKGHSKSQASPGFKPIEGFGTNQFINNITDSSRLFTEKLSRIETKIYETDTSAIKIPKLEEITIPGISQSISVSPMHSKSPSRVKMESLARLLGATKDSEEGWNQIKTQQNSSNQSQTTFS